jgi:hypothetical protein
VVFVLLAIYLFPLYPQAGSKNELVDWATAVSLVENNSVDISWAEPVAGVEFDGDTIKTDDAIYSTKAPGVALLGAPIYAIVRIFLGEPNKGNVHTSWFALRTAVGTVPLLFLGIWLYGREVDSYSLAILLFATPLFPYSLLLYSHVIAAILVYLAFRLMWDSARLIPDKCFTAAMLLGLAFLFEYSVAIPALIFGLSILATDRREKARRFIFFFAGLVPPLGALLIYNYFVFGSAFDFILHLGFSYPTLEAIYKFSLRPSHGLFSFAPILIMGALALFSSQDFGTKRHNIKIATIVVTFIAICGGAAADAEPTIGPRHMILIIPLLLDSVFDGELEEYPSHWRGLVFSSSVVLCAMPLMTTAFAPDALHYPHNSFWMPLLFDANVYGVTIVNTFGIAISFWTIFPAIVLIASVLAMVWRDSKYPIPFALGIFAGLGVSAVYVLAFSLEAAAGR